MFAVRAGFLLHPYPFSRTTITDWMCLLAANGDLTNLKAMLCVGGAPDVVGEGGVAVNVLYRAACNGHAAIVLELLNQGASPNWSGFAGFSSLMAAASGGHSQVVKLLLERGADPNQPDKHHGRPALLWAASSLRRGSEACVKLLLQAGAYHDYQDQTGYTALMAASSEDYHGNLGKVRALLRAGADPDLETTDGRTARSLASPRVASILDNWSTEFLSKEAPAQQP
jgi:ankyrin repeat protein